MGNRMRNMHEQTGAVAKPGQLKVWERPRLRRLDTADAEQSPPGKPSMDEESAQQTFAKS